MDCSLPRSSVHGIFQARVLEWVAISFSRGSSPPRDQTWVSRIVGRRFTIEPPGKIKKNTADVLFFLVLKPRNEQMCFMAYNMVKLFVEVYLRLHFEKQFASTFEYPMGPSLM